MKLNLSNRISLGYVFIIAVALAATLYCVYTLQHNKALSRRLQTVSLPVYLKLKDLDVMNREAQKLINNWIYQPNAAEKETLQSLQRTAYPVLKKELMDILDHSAHADPIKASLRSFESILREHGKVMTFLNTDSAYSNDQVVDQAIALYDNNITPGSRQLSRSLEQQLASQEEEINDLQTEKESADTFLTVLLLLMILLFVIAAVVAYFYAKRSIIEPIVKAKDLLVRLGTGKPTEVKASDREDEIGEMMTAMQHLTRGINDKSSFALAIGQGNYDEPFEMQSQEDMMGKALLDMRNNLRSNTEREQKRNWATRGLAEISAILRHQTGNVSEFYHSIIQYVVRYTGSNQGGIFLKQDEKNEACLELVACYAYDRKKFLEKRVAVGEGLLGQCVLEKQTVNMRTIPQNYIRITSGLGDAPPTNLVIVPLKVNEEVHGVMEIASFSAFAQYQVDFLEKLAENIASTIAAVRISHHTQALLLQSRQQAEEMKESQEELRQSMEELSATQEEMARKEKEYLKKIEALEEQVREKKLNGYRHSGISEDTGTFTF